MNDMKNADILLKVGGILVIDDSSYTQICKCINEYLYTCRYTEMHVLETFGTEHRIIKKIK